jgi:hypothetical protein
MEEAAADYAKEHGYEAPETGGGEPGEIVVDSGYDSPDDDWWYSWYGWCWVGDGIIIGDTPCGGFIEWLLDHCDQFPNLADRVIHHSQQRRTAGKGVELPGEVADAVERWQSKYPLTTSDGASTREAAPQAARYAWGDAPSAKSITTERASAR